MRAPVQHIDLMPTVLDLVRAPIPGRLRGRSLRPVLDDIDETVPVRPLYAEWNGTWWKNPQDQKAFPIQVLAFDPDQPVLSIAGIGASGEGDLSERVEDLLRAMPVVR